MAGDTQQTPRRRWRRVLRWLLLALILLVVLVVAGFLLLQTTWAKARLAGVVEERLSEQLEQEVAVRGLSGWLPWQVRVAEIRAADADGEWLAIDALAVDLQPLALLRRRVHLESVDMARLDLSRLPDLPEDDSPREEGGFAIAIDALRIEALRIGPAVAGAELSGAVALELEAEPGEPISGAATLNSANGEAEGELSFEIGPRQPRQVTLNLQWREATPVLSQLAGMPEMAPLALTLTAEGTLDALTWSGRLEHDGALAAVLRGEVAQDETGHQLVVTGRLWPEPWPRPELLAKGWREPLSLDLQAHRSTHNRWSLEAATLELPDGKLDARGVWSDDAGVQEASARLELADVAAWSWLAPMPLAGDLIVTLAARPLGEGLALEAEAAGSALRVGDWRADAPTLSVDARVAALTLPAWPELPEISGTLAISSAEVRGPEEQLAEPLRELAVSARLQSTAQRIVLEDLRVALPQGELGGMVAYAPESRQVSGKLAWQLPELTALKPWLPHEARGGLGGETTFALQLPSLNGSLSTELTWRQAAYGELDLAAIAGAPIELSTSLERRDEVLVIERLRVAAGERTATASGRFATSLTGTLEVAASWPELQALPGLGLAGDWAAEGSLISDAEGLRGELSWEADALRMDELAVQRVTGKWQLSAPPLAEGSMSLLRLAGTGVVSGLRTPAELPIDGFDYRLAGQWDGASTVEIEELALSDESLQLALSGDYDWEGNAVDAVATLRVAELARFAELAGQPLAGELALRIEAVGALPEPALTVSATGRSLIIAGQELPTATVTTTLAQANDDGWSGELTAETVYRRQPLAMTTRWQASPSQVRLTDLDLRLPDGAATGDLTYIYGSPWPTGSLQLRLASLGMVAQLTGLPLSGELSAVVTLAEAAATVDLTGQALQSPWGTAEALRLQIHGEGLAAQPRVTATLVGSGLEREAIHLETVEAEVAGWLDNVSFDIAGEGLYQERELALQARGSLRDQQALALDFLSGSLDGQELRLLAPTSVRRQDGQITLAETRLELGPGRVTASATYGPETLAAELRLAAFPLREILPPGFSATSGQVSGSAHFGGRPEAPTATVDLELRELRLIGPSELVLFAGGGRLAFTYGDQAARGTIRFTGERSEHLLLEGEVPLTLSLKPFLASFPKHGGIDASLDIAMELGEVLVPLLPDGHRVAGTLRGDLRITGALEDLDIAGPVTLTNGLYENYFTGTVLKDLTVRLKGLKDRLAVDELSATDGAAGTLSGSGAWRFFQDSLEFDLRVANFRVVRHENANVNAGGRLRLSGSREALSLTGNVEVAPAEIRLADMAGRLPDVEVTETRGGVPLEPATARTATDSPTVSAKAASPLPTLSFAVSVVSPGRVFVRGRGLDSEWRGRLRLAGTAASPRLLGELNLVRGTFNLAGKPLRLVEGELRLDGSQPISPTIRLVAEGSADTATVRLIFMGPLTAPDLQVESSPSMPEDEALSRLLFGRGTGGISALQALRLAQIRENLGQGGNGFDVSERLRSITGLDVVDLAPAEDEEGMGRLRMGKYINERLYLQYGKGLGETDDRISIEAEVTPNISVESSTTSGGNTGVGLNWKFDY